MGQSMDTADPGRDRAADGAAVVVPPQPAPVVPLHSPDARRHRGRDDLDELIDELLPDVDDGPGWADVTLIIAGAALLAWVAVGSGPSAALVGGLVAIGLGCVLPARSLWRAAGRHRERRRRRALLASGMRLDVTSDASGRLVAAYEALLVRSARVDPDVAGAAIAAAHGALVEVASLLAGRVPAPGRERDYVEQRASAVERLASALGDPAVPPDSAEPYAEPSPAAAVVEARDELDSMTGTSTVTRLEELAAEAQARDGRRL